MIHVQNIKIREKVKIRRFGLALRQVWWLGMERFKNARDKMQ